MFAKLATILAIGRRHPLPANALPGRRIDQVRPHGRPNLLCRWHLDPASGRPVCAWRIDDVPLQEAAGSGSALRVNGTARLAVPTVDA